MPDEMDVQRLIAEVKIRPTLWDVRYSEYKDRSNTPQLWQEIADLLGVDVEACKRKWKNLRDAYRAEVRRNERRVERFKATGTYDPSMSTTSKWVYFEPMSFINEAKRPRYAPFPSTCMEGTSKSQESQENAQSEPNTINSFCDIKMEPQHVTTDEDVDDDDDKLFEEFQSVATPQAARRLSGSISLANAVEEEAQMAAGVSSSCKCAKRTDDQVHFLEDLEREELKLMKSTRQEITRANSVGHVGDADYNFLVSFLPQMKKMTELQNLQFRAKMSEMLLNIMAPSAMLPAPILLSPASVSASMCSSTTTLPAQGVIQCVAQPMQTQQQPVQQTEVQQQQQHQQQQHRCESMDTERGESGASAGAVVTTSSSSWS